MATATLITSSSGQPSSPTGRTFVFEVDMDASYPTGGEVIAAITDVLGTQANPIQTIVASHEYVQDVGGTTRKFKLDETTRNVMARTLADVEVANATDLSGHLNIRLIVVCE